MYILRGGVQCGACEGHPVLPADERADTADLCGHRMQAAAVTLSPPHPLGHGRHHLAVPIQQPPIRTFSINREHVEQALFNLALSCCQVTAPGCWLVAEW